MKRLTLNKIELSGYRIVRLNLQYKVYELSEDKSCYCFYASFQDRKDLLSHFKDIITYGENE